MDTVIAFSSPALGETTGAPAHAKLVSGQPEFRSQLFFTSPDGSFVSGIWTSSPGKWRAASGKEEFCHIVSGHLRLVSDCGTVQEFRTGESFVVSNEFSGFWEVIEETTKHYAIRKY